MYVALVIAILFSVFQVFVIAHHSSQFAGPYEVIIRQIAHCKNSGTDETRFDMTKMNKVNKTTYLYSSNFSLPYGLSDNIVLVVSCYVWGNGGWKPLGKDREIGPACSSIKKLSPKLVKDVAKAMGTWPKVCPNPPGNYTLSNLALNIELNIPVLPYNKYILEFWLNHKKVRTGCGRAFVDIVPRKRARKHH